MFGLCVSCSSQLMSTAKPEQAQQEEKKHQQKEQQQSQQLQQEEKEKAGHSKRLKSLLHDFNSLFKG